MRILCTGDVHIGRRSSGVEGTAHSCAEAWQRICRLAIGDLVGKTQIDPVDLVVVSGDLTDENNRYYQAIGPIERGLALLARAKIPVVVVAGNHDHHTLKDVHRAVRTQYAFHPLGFGATWETREIGGVRLVGWSYPDARYPDRPIPALQLPPSDLPTLGVVHVQRTADPNYAFATPDDFWSQTNVDRWLIGHVHLPDSEGDTGSNVLNPGSPQAMDANEAGWHGVWLLTAQGGQFLPPKRIPLSTVWYENLALTLTPEIETLSDFREFIFQSVQERIQTVSQQNPQAESLQIRIDLNGRSPLNRKALQGQFDSLVGTEQGNGNLQAVVTKISAYQLRPPIDLVELGRSGGPHQVLARALLALEDPVEAEWRDEALVAKLLKAAEDAGNHSGYVDVRGKDQPEEAVVRQWARDHAYRMLELLDDQRNPSGETA